LNLNKQPGAQEDIFFDRNPRVFEVILDFYRTGTVNRPSDVTLEMLKEELAFFQIELPEVGITNKRVSMELMKLEYMNIMLPATEYRKMARMKILSDHLTTIVKILDFMQMKIEKKARSGHNSCALTFYSPLHYTNSTPPSIFKVVSTDEIREILIELLEAKGFDVKETNEYSKTKATSIIGSVAFLCAPCLDFEF
jgi:energy-converting hydrogenase Eha subunit C